MKIGVWFLLVGMAGVTGVAWAQDGAATSEEVPTWLRIAVPVGGGKLGYREVRSTLPRYMPVDDRGYISEVASRTLPILLVQAAAFPKGTKLLELPRIEGKVMRVNLSREFWGAKYWKSEEQTNIMIDAVVNTAIGDLLGNEFRVQLMREGKVMKHLGTVYVGKPLPARGERF